MYDIQHTSDNECDKNIGTDMIDIEKLIIEKIEQLSISNILEQLEDIQKLICYTILTQYDQIPLVEKLITTVNHIAYMEKGIVPYLAEKIEDILYEICNEVQDTLFNYIEIRHPNTNHIPSQDNTMSLFIEADDPILPDPLSETNTTIPCMNIDHISKNHIIQRVTNDIETNTTIPCMNIDQMPTSHIIQRVTSDIETNTTIPCVNIDQIKTNKSVTPFIHQNKGEKGEKNKKRQKSPVPKNKRKKRQLSHKKIIV